MTDISKKILKEQFKNRACIGGVYRIKCHGNNAFWIRATTDMQGSKNRFAFSIATHACPETRMAKAWHQFGASAFSFEVLDEIKKKETQTKREFAEDVNALLAIWTESAENQDK